MKKIIIFLMFPTLFFSNGCGMVSLLGTPTRQEKIIPAEFSLFKNKDKQILVLVNQPAWLSAGANLSYHITGTTSKHLVDKLKLSPSNIIDYDKLLEFRSNVADSLFLSPVQIGQMLSADIVLFIAIEDYKLDKTAEMDYYRGYLNAKVILLDTTNGEKLWPESEQYKAIKVGFDVEQGGRDVAITRLANALAHCTTRYFYDCPLPKFKIFEDKSGTGWQQWD